MERGAGGIQGQRGNGVMDNQKQTNAPMPLLSVDSVKKYFPLKTEFGTTGKWLKAVDGISFEVGKNCVFAIVGESGCGKSTVARIILKLLKPTEGTVLFKGEDIAGFNGLRLKQFRRSVQIVFQDPFASLNPRMRVFDTLSEPLKIHNILRKKDIPDRVVQLLEQVGLNKDALYRYPHEFSGGQRQRICIARALALSPELIICDEPLSALDVSIQAQILNLFLEIRKMSAISFIFISHDLKVVRYFSDEVAVMHSGKIVEQAKTENLFRSPKHPYTELLLSSAPKLRYMGE
ncbi:MAG: ATP-binding cassette domain-containing protein [Dissulfurispiraceae bacterium]|jgi:ABC-type oligopeptide transport system ATPase subunit